MIVFTHLLNDRSGSPRVLRSVIGVLSQHHAGSLLFLGSSGSGILDDAPVPIIRYPYKRHGKRLMTLVSFLCSQMLLFIRLLRNQQIDRDAVIYVNTLLPFGAALYGRVTSRQVIYHLHEVSVPAPLGWFLTAIARLTASRLIYVSDFHRKCLPIRVPACTVYNALDENFLARGRSTPYLHRHQGRFTVLMLASLRDYKGVPEFVELARLLTARKDISFDLVANDSDSEARQYFSNTKLPENLTVHPRTADPAVHYAKASLVLNMSRPDRWVETFGMTLLEAMAFGIPLIAPPVGGPAEIVSDGCEGFLIDSRDSSQIARKVEQLADDHLLCQRVSEACRRKAAQFAPAAFAEALRDVIRLV